VAGTAEQIAQGLDAAAWQRLSAGDGTKGERLYDWAYCELADLDAAEYNEALSAVWTRGLLIRRHGWRTGLLLDLVSGRNWGRHAGDG
jgi:SRSO17 transposase